MEIKRIMRRTAARAAPARYDAAPGAMLPGRSVYLSVGEISAFNFRRSAIHDNLGIVQVLLLVHLRIRSNSPAPGFQTPRNAFRRLRAGPPMA